MEKNMDMCCFSWLAESCFFFFLGGGAGLPIFFSSSDAMLEIGLNCS